MTHVASLWIYPVKGCAGVSVNEAELTPGGFARDRRYMLVDPEGNFLSQRTVPELVLFRTRLLEREIVVHSPPVSTRDKLRLPLAVEQGNAVRATVWRDQVTLLEHPEGSAWFSDVLKRPLRLVYQPESSLRLIRARPPSGSNQGTSATMVRANETVSLADAYPLLLTNKASLEDLNLRLAHPISMTRFRPNIVVTDATAYEEDQYEDIVIGSLPFSMPKLCDRCSVTTVDPMSGKREKEPLKTLATYRKWEGAVWFGANLIHHKPGKVRLGDLLRPVPAT